MLLISIGMVKGETRDGPFVKESSCWSCERFQTANSAADDDSETIRDYLLQIDPAVFHRHLGGGHGKLRETIRPPHVLRIFEKMLSDRSCALRRRSGSRNALTSNAFDHAMPLTPFFRLSQKVSTSLPSGVMTPSPVITTLRSIHDWAKAG